MRIEDDLKQKILEKYKSVRAFTTAVQIPYSTIDSMLKKGLSGTAVSTVIKVCESLNLDVDALVNGKIKEKSPVEENLSTEDKDAILGYKIYRYLVDSGLIDEGQELTPTQIDFLEGIEIAVTAFFDKSV